MPYRVELMPRLLRQLPAWPMPDVLLVDVHQRLAELRNDPWRLLVRAERPFEGMMLVFSLVDPINRLCEHRFAFHAVYGQDEQTLYIPGGAHERFTARP